MVCQLCPPIFSQFTLISTNNKATVLFHQLRLQMQNTIHVLALLQHQLNEVKNLQ